MKNFYQYIIGLFMVLITVSIQYIIHSNKEVVIISGSVGVAVYTAMIIVKNKESQP